MKKTLLLATFAAVSLAACNGEKQEEKAAENQAANETTQAQQMPANHPDISQLSHAGQASAPQNKGVVKEILQGGGYTYAAVETGGQIIWVAGPAANIKVGETVGWSGGSLMSGFTSPTLNRTFDSIYFVSGFQKVGAVNATRGTVTETIHSAGYVYIKVDQNGKELWLAAPETDIKDGATVSWQGGAVMRNFQSNSLGRRFEQIVFVDHVNIEG